MIAKQEVSTLLPCNARLLLVDACKVDPYAARGASDARREAIDKAIMIVKKMYPNKFRKDE